MNGLRLPKLPDRTPVKLVINISPDLHQALNDYGELYARAYGEKEPVAELIPAMLASFLNSDRAFTAARRQLSRDRT